MSTFDILDDMKDELLYNVLKVIEKIIRARYAHFEMLTPNSKKTLGDINDAEYDGDDTVEHNTSVRFTHKVFHRLVLDNLFEIEVINTSDGATVRIKDPVSIETLREKVYAAGCSIILKADGIEA